MPQPREPAETLAYRSAGTCAGKHLLATFASVSRRSVKLPAFSRASEFRKRFQCLRPHGHFLVVSCAAKRVAVLRCRRALASQQLL